MFNTRFESESGFEHGTAVLHFLPRIGEEVHFCGCKYVVSNIIYHLQNGTRAGQDVTIVLKRKEKTK